MYGLGLTSDEDQLDRCTNVYEGHRVRLASALHAFSVFLGDTRCIRRIADKSASYPLSMMAYKIFVSLDPNLLDAEVTSNNASVALTKCILHVTSR